MLFYIKEAFLSTKKNGIMSIGTMISLTATLFIVGLFLLISLNIHLFMNNIESQLMAIAYLESDLSENEIRELVQNISELEGVNEASYISKEEAFKKLKNDLAEHEEILSGIQENPLPPSIEILVQDSSFLEEIALQLDQYEGIEEINYGGQLTENLIVLFQFIRKSGLLMIAILVFISILIMVSVIKISVHSRQKEIEIMTLVGATSWFIRWPFIIEGFLKGFLSAILAVLVLGKTYFYYLDKVRKILPFISILMDQGVLLEVAAMMVGLGILIGVFGSILSLRKISYEEI